jgi:hypothetical protein
VVPKYFQQLKCDLDGIDAEKKRQRQAFQNLITACLQDDLKSSEPVKPRGKAREYFSE